MKLNMEFEASDLEDMITEYFERNGFVVLDVESIVEKFSNIYPEGITIQVKAAPAEPASTSTHTYVLREDDGVTRTPTDTASVEEVVEDLKEKVEEAAKVAAPPRLSLNDLMDPTGDSGVPNRDQLLAERELQHVLKQSKEIEESK